MSALLDIAVNVVELARKAGADDCECTAAEGEEFSVNVRLGEVETLTEAGSRAAGIRVLVGKNVGSAYTSDLSSEGLRAMVAQAVDIARVTTEDPHAGLPDESELGRYDGDLKMYSDAVNSLDTEWKIEQAKAAEAAALQFDSRIVNSEGGSFGSNISRNAFANSRRFAGEYISSSCSISAVPVAKDGENMQRDYWFSIGRDHKGLESAESVGRKAAERVTRRLGARKVPTQKVPVILEPRIARSLLDHIFSAVSGDSIYRGESFLAGKLGQKIASGGLTVNDDAIMPGLFGSSPFDDEGVPSRRTVVVKDGVLESYLLNSYTARKLGMKTTGNAARGLTGNAGVGHGNLFAEAGTVSPADMLASVKNGLYVTELMGFGVNTVTGDYSRGAAGLWIENGQLTFPVHEITIASTLQEMLLGLDAIGNDLEFRGSVASPTLLIREMTISGQ